MNALDISLDGDGCWPDLKDRAADTIHMGEGSPPIGIACLARGMTKRLTYKRLIA